LQMQFIRETASTLVSPITPVYFSPSFINCL
jgi:hypothetical protein